MTEDERRTTLLKLRMASEHMSNELMLQKNAANRYYPAITPEMMTGQLIMLTDLLLDLIERKD